MILASVVSVAALLAYAFLLFAAYGSLRRREVRSFALFLVVMLVWQIGGVGVSFTSDATVARGFYILLVGLVGCIGVLYAQFARSFLGIRTRGWLISLGYGMAILFAMWTLLGGSGVIEKVYPSEYTGLLVPEFGLLFMTWAAATYAYFAYSAGILIRHHRHSTSTLTRSRIEYLVLGLTIVFLGTVANFSERLRGYPIDIAANMLNALLIAYAILRYHLLDISIVIRKGLLYSTLTAVTGIIYFVPIFLATNILHLAFGYQVFLLSLILALLTVLLAQPLRDRVQGVIDRRFFREKYDSSRMLQRLSRTVASFLDIHTVTEMILADVMQTMHIASGAFLIRRDEDGTYRVQTQRGDAPIPRDLSLFRPDAPIISWLARHQTCLSSRVLDTDPSFIGLWTREREDIKQSKAELFVPLLVRGKLIGILVLGPKLSETAYTTEEQQVLGTLANQTAVAIENASLFSETLAEQERTATIVEQAFAGIVLLDSEFRVTGLNPAAEAILGRPSVQIIGQPLSSAIGPGITDEGSSLHQAARTSQRVAPREETLMCAGKPCDVLLGVAPMIDGYLLSLADITQIKEADRLKSDIVATVSHEFRTPLAIIKAYAELLADEQSMEDTAMRREFLSVIDSEVNRLTGLVNDLLDLARLEARREVEERAPLAMTEIIDEAIAEARFQAHQHEVSIDVSVAPDLPMVLGNKKMLVTMLRNLVNNAIKFSHPGGRVEVSAEQVSSSLLLRVADHGIGISETDLPHLFEKFYRSTAAQQAGIRGTGIGLVLVKQAVEAHQGSIRVESQIGSGTCFTIHLPANGMTAEAAARRVEVQAEPEMAR